MMIFVSVVFPIGLVVEEQTVGDKASEVPADDTVPCVAVFGIELFARRVSL